MAAIDNLPVRLEAGKILLAVAFALSFAWIAIAAIEFTTHEWLLDAHGRPLPSDFIEVWVAGKFALGGNPAAPYDWQVHHAAQVAAAGHPFKGYFGWHYPPLFLLVAGGLALLPYFWAAVLWLTTTFCAYAIAINKVAGRTEAALFALASPGALGNIVAGQNGFLSGALIGFALLFSETRPVLAGVFLGLLSYKPQLGLLFPIVLVTAAHWKMLGSAAVTAALCIAVPYLAFGGAPFVAFLHFLPITSHAILAGGMAGWNKLQTFYGLVRSSGGSDALAWTVQITLAFLVSVSVAWLWRRSDVSHAIKAAALAAGVLALTPYLYAYDLPILAIPIAFLSRDRAFDRADWITLGLLGVIFGFYMLASFPVGPILLILVASMIARRSFPRGIARHGIAAQPA